MIRALLLSTLTIFLVVLLGTSASAAAVKALRPSDLNKNREKYDQQQVVVEGILLINLPHNDHLKAIYDSNTRRKWIDLKSKLGFRYQQKHPDKSCVSIDNPDMIWDNIKNPRYRRVRIKGVFAAQTESPWEIVSGTCATGTGIWIEEILEVR